MKVKFWTISIVTKNTGALLLTGPWGCGKSYLMKQIAKDLNQEKAAAIAVISLFGLDSISAINKRVKDEYISLKLGTLGKSCKKTIEKISHTRKRWISCCRKCRTGRNRISRGFSGPVVRSQL